MIKKYSNSGGRTAQKTTKKTLSSGQVAVEHGNVYELREKNHQKTILSGQLAVKYSNLCELTEKNRR